MATALFFGFPLALFAAMLGMARFGFNLGKRRAACYPQDHHEGLGSVEGAVFAILGLMLAFLFSGASNRLEERREAAIHEANAIGTAYLRVDLLPDSDARRIREYFRNYLDNRLQAIENRLDHEAFTASIRAAEGWQQRIWSDVVAVVPTLPDREVERILIEALNEMIDVATERNTIAQTHAALPVQAFLMFLALVGATLAGFSMSRAPALPVLHMVLFSVVITVTIYCILDMEYPRLGFIRIGAADRPMIELFESMQR